MRRIAGDGRVGDLNPNELDEFVSERGVRPPVRPEPPILVSVPAYPPKETPDGSAALAAPASRRRVKTRRLSHLMSSAWRGACAVVYAPFAVVGFVVLRSYWLAWWVVYGCWRAVTATVGLFVWTLRAVARAASAAAAFLIASIVAAGRAALRAIGAIRAGLAALAELTIRAGRRTRHSAALGCLVMARAAAHGAHRATSAIIDAGAAVLQGVSHATAYIGAALVSLARGAAASATIARALAARVRVRIELAASIRRTAREWGRPVVLRSALAVGVVALVTSATMSLVPRATVARPAAPAMSKAVEAPPAATTPLAPVVVPPSRRETDTRPAPRRERAPAVRPAAARGPPAAGVRAAADVRPATDVRSEPAVNAETVRAIWRETDTRSLDRALSAVRQATLAFRRCNVQTTSADQAVARCDVASGDGDAPGGDTAWTIEFRRADERWLIERIATRAAP